MPAPKLCSSIARRWPAGTAEELFDLFFKDKGDLARANHYEQGELDPVEDASFTRATKPVP
ncbi:MAG: hypothetical protein WA231_19760 [Methylocella sp.]